MPYCLGDCRITIDRAMYALSTLRLLEENRE